MSWGKPAPSSSSSSCVPCALWLFCLIESPSYAQPVVTLQLLTQRLPRAKLQPHRLVQSPVIFLQHWWVSFLPGISLYFYEFSWCILRFPWELGHLSFAYPCVWDLQFVLRNTYWRTEGFATGMPCASLLQTQQNENYILCRWQTLSTFVYFLADLMTSPYSSQVGITSFLSNHLSSSISFSAFATSQVPHMLELFLITSALTYGFATSKICFATITTCVQSL